MQVEVDVLDQFLREHTPKREAEPILGAPLASVAIDTIPTLRDLLDGPQ
ncbi:hypothetical protein [Mitsuaria sp. GD03876]|nr:hypothetical protein [Mitsuaria sp. GD03876]MDH0863238.1 hypothetical protein [Mitsuaria sp. GD03876]